NYYSSGSRCDSKAAPSNYQRARGIASREQFTDGVCSFRPRERGGQPENQKKIQSSRCEIADNQRSQSGAFLTWLAGRHIIRRVDSALVGGEALSASSHSIIILCAGRFYE